MEKIKRNGRMSAIVRILTASPNRIFTLNHFCMLFDAAKSTISEDIELLRGTFSQFSLGEIETVAGAAGGVRYIPGVPSEDVLRLVRKTCARLGEPTRVLPGGFLFMSDILGDPVLMDQFGMIIAAQFIKGGPDFVLAVESRGIIFAIAVARAMGLPLLLARRESGFYEGPQVSVNYISGSTGRVRTISLARRMVGEGQRALLIDDFMRAGGTVSGMENLMQEFSVEVVGIGVLIRKNSQSVSPKHLKSLMVLQDIDGLRGAQIIPAQWLEDMVSSE